MKKLFAVFALLAMAGSAFAADTKVTTSVEHTNFTEQFGERNVASVEAVTKSGSGDATFVFTGSYGERKFDDGASFSGQRVGGQLYIDWSENFYTRTAVSAATNDPVFAKRDYAQDFNFKSGGTTFLLGARYTDFYGDVTVKSYSAGITQKFGDRFSASYRFTQYDSDLTGTNNGNLVSLKLKDADSDGSTQLWLGYADTLYAYDWLPAVSSGKQKSAVIRRVQPLSGNVSLNMLFGKSWYETPVADYEGVTGGLGLTFGW